MKSTDNSQELQTGLAQEVLLHRITNRVRQSLELQEILTTTVAEIRSFLGTERVMIYRFHAQGSGEVIAESIDENRLPSLLGLNFPADDIPPRAYQRFTKTRQRSIVNVTSGLIGVSALDCPQTGQLLETTEIHYRPADPCHLEYLKAMGVQFSLVVPILHRDQLWGLLVCHHSEPFSISQQQLELVQRVADQVSIAIAQSTLFSLARQQAEREATVNRVATLLHTLQTLPLQASLEETIAVLQGCGGRLYLKVQNNQLSPEVYTSGAQPLLTNLETGKLIEQCPQWQDAIAHCLKSTQQKITTSGNGVGVYCAAVTDIYNEPHLQAFVPAFRTLGIRSLLIVPLQYRQQSLGYLTIFRHEINIETWWAGRFDSSQQQLQPRKSFEAWREFKRGQPREWTTEEIEVAQVLSNHFSMAIQQYQLYQQVSALNANLEHQIEERTVQLQQSLKFARILNQVTDQIRSTLELPNILQTIVREVRELLNTDRVIVYHFLETWRGKVVVEDVIDKSFSILGNIYDDNCFPVEYTYQYKAGRVRAINNILEADLSPCHVEFLQKIQVQANLVVGITRGEQLWGLLVAHECQSPRAWQAWEVEFLQQLAAQAAIAIHQAELYEQSRTDAATAIEKAHQLESALDQLQRTQSQLIQTEKMSSLGQLVAGVAHEINNPVNFIYGNLMHIGQYTQDVLKLVELYQEDYPHPTPKILEQVENIDLEYLLEDLPKMLSSMKVGTDRIRQLVLSLRNFSRLDEAERKPVDIHEGLESTLLILQHRLKGNGSSSGIQIIKNYADLPPVECYAAQLNQVFMNVLSNAMDALEQRDHQRSLEEIQNSPSQITIRTSLRKEDKTSSQPNSNSLLSTPSVVIQISDNGTGMTEAVKAKIFHPFFTTKPVGKGTGLGLSISYQIVVEKHGGVFNCNSKLGHGTEFWIEVPIQ